MFKCCQHKPSLLLSGLLDAHIPQTENSKMQASNALSISGNKRSREQYNDSQSSNNQLQLISSTKDLTSSSTSSPHIQPTTISV